MREACVVSPSGRTPHFKVAFDASHCSFHGNEAHAASLCTIKLIICFFPHSFLSLTLKNMLPSKNHKSVLFVNFIILGPHSFNYIKFYCYSFLILLFTI